MKMILNKQKWFDGIIHIERKRMSDLNQCNQQYVFAAFNLFFPKWSRTFTELSEFGKFRESHKSLKHELGSI